MENDADYEDDLLRAEQSRSRAAHGSETYADIIAEAERAMESWWIDVVGGQESPSRDEKLLWNTAFLAGRKAHADKPPNNRIKDLLRDHAALNERFVNLKNATGLCDEHQPTGENRNCLLCGHVKLSRALDRISYLVDTPNEHEVSDYGIGYDEQHVVQQVQKAVRDHEAFKTRVVEFHQELVDIIKERKASGQPWRRIEIIQRHINQIIQG